MAIFFLFSFILLFFKGSAFLDPDFGWHLKMGELITSSGIPKLDPFSYTMPSFPYIDIQWLTNVIFKVLYPNIGMAGLSAIYAFIVLLCLFVALKSVGKIRSYWEVPIILATAILFGYFGVRPQVASWLLWAVFLFVVLNERRLRRWWYFLPALVILWVNLHGSFAISVATLFLIGIVKLWQKKLKKDFVLIFFLSILATFINPYGPRIWHEVWLQISDSSLRWRIMEWQPALFSFNLPLLFYIGLSTTFIWLNRKKFDIAELVLYVFFLLQGLASVRHIPLWLILSLPMTIKAFNLYKKEINKIPLAPVRLAKVYRLALYGSLFIALVSFALSFNSALYLKENRFYPKQAIAYLKNNLPKGEIFSEYGWGGYLIWKLPEKKVFVDGRMPSWRYKNSPASESGYIMQEYLDLLNGKKPYQEVFAKYGVELVLWPKPRPLDPLAQFAQKLDKLLFKKLSSFDLISELNKGGWYRVYEGDAFVIFRKPQ